MLKKMIDHKHGDIEHVLILPKAKKFCDISWKNYKC